MTYLLLLLPLLFLLGLLSLQGLVGSADGRWSMDWVPALDVAISFDLSPLGNLFALVVAFIGFWVYFYGIQYMKKYSGTGRFWFFLSLFMAAMLGVVVADNLIALFVFWEFTSICSYFLIGFYHNKQESRDSALMALLVTGLGGIVLLAGFIILAEIGGTYEISNLSLLSSEIAQHPHAWIALVMIFIGAGTKSAQFPFHFWLPNAMAAPAPVSSFLHSATMVKAGVFLMARLFPVLSGIDSFAPLLTIIGGLTFVWGGFIAITEYDLKSILAHTTISALGLLIFLLGLGNTYALKAFALFFLAHAFYKAPFFMAAGVVEKRYGTRDIRQLGGGLKDDKLLSAALILAAISMMGLPPAVGFIAKETILESQLSNPLMLMVIIMGSVFNFVAALKIVHGVLFGSNRAPVKYEPGMMISVAPFVLALTGTVLGLTGGLYQGLYVSDVVGQMQNTQVSLKIALWHGINLPLMLSGLAVILGFACFKTLNLSEKLIAVFRKLAWLSPVSWYPRLLNGTLNSARIFTDIYQSGYLRRYQLIILVASLIMMQSAVLRFSPASITLDGEIFLIDFLIGGIMVFSMVAALMTSSKIWFITLLGVVGLGVVLFYVIYGAPDLALTQLMVEIFTLMIFVFALNKLPRLRYISAPLKRARDIAVSTFFGAIMAFMTYVSFSVDMRESVSDYYAANSYLLAHGKNIVNVILVDFRAFDTFGEVAVLLMAALGVYILLSKKKPARKGNSNE
jgi:multicomponent Na+:H+ antiporter subunit A